MAMQFEKVQNRRQLFTSVLRYATLGVLGAVGGFTYAKRRRLVKNGICINRQICGAVEYLKNAVYLRLCRLRRTLKRINDGRK